MHMPGKELCARCEDWCEPKHSSERVYFFQGWGEEGAQGDVVSETLWRWVIYARERRFELDCMLFGGVQARRPEMLSAILSALGPFTKKDEETALQDAWEELFYNDLPQREYLSDFCALWWFWHHNIGDWQRLRQREGFTMEMQSCIWSLSRAVHNAHKDHEAWLQQHAPQSDDAGALRAGRTIVAKSSYAAWLQAHAPQSDDAFALRFGHVHIGGRVQAAF